MSPHIEWRKGIPPFVSQWAKNPMMFYGWTRRSDGFMELVGGNSKALTFSLRSDGFLSLDTIAAGNKGLQISKKRRDKFLEFLTL